MITDCKTCEKAPLTRMITFPVISPRGKRHIAQTRNTPTRVPGKFVEETHTKCGKYVTDAWVRP